MNKKIVSIVYMWTPIWFKYPYPWTKKMYQLCTCEPPLDLIPLSMNQKKCINCGDVNPQIKIFLSMNPKNWSLLDMMSSPPSVQFFLLIVWINEYNFYMNKRNTTSMTSQNITSIWMQSKYNFYILKYNFYMKPADPKP
jgi:hypothetical protein